MKRFVNLLVSFLLLAIGCAQLFAPAPVSAASEISKKMTISGFEADYYLTKDSNNVSHLRIVEKISVRFISPNVHGIERVVPSQYDNHTTRLKVLSTKEAALGTVPFETSTLEGNTVIKIGDPNKTIDGERVYTIEYTQQDVIKNFDGHDELFWDTNGTDWGVPVGQVRARLHLSGAIAEAFNGQYTCYEGAKNMSARCAVEAPVDNNGQTIITFSSSRSMFAGENLSFVTGFKPTTFLAYQPTATEKWAAFVGTFWLKLGLVVLAVTLYKIVREWRKNVLGPKGKGTIVPEYLPPKDLSVMAASALLGRRGKDITAQIIDLAVRGFIKIYENEKRKLFWGKSKSYDLELIKLPDALKAEEKQLIDVIFGENPELPARVSLEGTKSKLYKATEKLAKQVKEQAKQRGLLTDISTQRKQYVLSSLALLVVAVVFLNPLIGVAAVALGIAAIFFGPPSQLGVQYRDHLYGLRDYMKLAEADRIATLQSPDGALKVPAIAQKAAQGDTSSLLKLHERLLPYAVLFGLEKKWAKQFALLYQDQQPNWFVGNNSAFNAALFTSSLNSFSTVSNMTFSSPTNSSSSGFSASGGSSGGGGGGGGGGAW